MELNELKKSWWVISSGMPKYKANFKDFGAAIAEARTKAEAFPTMRFEVLETVGAFKAKVIDTEMEQFTYVD